jgi:hypothetical protein
MADPAREIALVESTPVTSPSNVFVHDSSFLGQIFTTQASLCSLGAYLLWTISLGGLGAGAFLAVNSLGIQTDTSFDIGDRSLIFMRLVVGSRTPARRQRRLGPPEDRTGANFLADAIRRY